MNATDISHHCAWTHTHELCCSTKKLINYTTDHKLIYCKSRTICMLNILIIYQFKPN